MSESVPSVPCMPTNLSLVLALTLVAAAAGLPPMPGMGDLQAQEKEVIQLPGAPQGLPFSTAVRVGDLLFLSGVIGRRPGTLEVVPGGIRPETRQALSNIQATLEVIGSAMDRVVKCTVFLRDIADYSKMNEVYATFFPSDPPARSTLAASGLALDARVEIDCIALAGTP